MPRHHLTANEAAEALGVTKASLYAYVSRGQVRTSRVPGHPRESRYLREDIERLKDRKAARRDPAVVAARGLHWGSAVLESGITLIQDGTLYYRGRDALELARTATLEQTAELLWGGEPVGWSVAFAQARKSAAKLVPHIRNWTKDPATALQLILPAAGALDPMCHDLRPSASRQTGARILGLMASMASGGAETSPHLALQSVWSRSSRHSAEAIRTALVLCADHELNVSTFTARCAASAGATLYDVVSAALATLKGSRHGGAAERVSALIDEVGTPRRARAVLARRQRLGEQIPGFGHPLYPSGDPRARLLLELAQHGENQAELRLAQAVERAAVTLLNDQPTLDFALAVLARAFRMPAHAPFLLFALGRTAGWIAHALEQYRDEELIRPRARYVGPMP